MLTMPPRTCEAPEVCQILKLYLLAFQNSPFCSRFCKRTPGISAAVVDVELEALATVEDAGEFALDLARDLKESWRAEGVCVCSEGVREVMFVDGVSQLRRQVQQGAGVLAGGGHG